jgi:hypothetical protein
MYAAQYLRLSEAGQNARATMNFSLPQRVFCDYLLFPVLLFENCEVFPAYEILYCAAES